MGKQAGGLLTVKRFSYFAPRNITEALNFLDQYPDCAKLLAGGTDLIVQMNNQYLNPQHLVDLKTVAELKGIYIREEGLRIGSLTTVSEIESSAAIAKIIPFLAEAAKTVGSVQIRNRATIGGNLCRAAPSADLIPPLLVLDSRIKIQSSHGARVIPLEKFFCGPGKTTLRSDEILTEIIISTPPSSGVGIYLKHGPRQTMDLAVVGVAVFLICDSKLACERARIAFASVAPTPMRAKKAEEVLQGKNLTEDVIRQVAAVAAGEINPLSDVYGDDWYKRAVGEVLVRRAISLLKRMLEAGQ
jgi:aerobic carbon-monoxide dehydrogenase medium subunit